VLSAFVGDGSVEEELDRLVEPVPGRKARTVRQTPWFGDRCTTIEPVSLICGLATVLDGRENVRQRLRVRIWIFEEEERY
jgi:hypothetical protein